jgi:hypothetical protein
MAAPTRNIKESTIQSQILSFLKARRILHNRVNNGQFQIEDNAVDKYGRKRRKRRAVRCNTLNGIPDIEVFAYIDNDGVPFFPLTIYLEVKNKTGRQSKHQKLFQQRIESANGFYYVVRSVQDVIDAFNKTEKEIKERFGKKFKLGFLKAFSLPELGGKM